MGWEKFVYKKPKPQYGFLYPDLSLSEIADSIEQKPISDIESLGRLKFAKQLADQIEKIVPYSSFCIGINGSWGSGKTSLIELIVDQIKQNKTRKKTIIKFSPWLFNNTESLVSNFFTLLESHFQNKGHLYRELKTYKKQLAAIEKSTIKTEFFNLFEENKSIEDRFMSIKSALEKIKENLIVIIDDLDRLNSSEIIDVLRVIRLIANFPNTFYIVGYDRNFLNHAIRKQLTGYEYEKYLDKFFQLEFNIPDLIPSVVSDRLKDSLTYQLSLLEQGKMTQPNVDHILTSVRYSFLNKFIRNERDIKRFTNNLLLRFNSLKTELNLDQFFLLELIYYKSPTVYASIYENQNKIFAEIVELKHNYSGEKKEKINFKGILHPDIMASKEEIFEVLEELFKIESDRTNSITDPKFFNNYFTLNVLSNFISDAEFMESFSDRTDIDTLCANLILYQKRNSPLLKERIWAYFRTRNLRTSEPFKKAISSLVHLYKFLTESNTHAYQETEGVNKIDLANLIAQLYYQSAFADKFDYLQDIFLNDKSKRYSTYAGLCLFISHLYMSAKEMDRHKEFSNIYLILVAKAYEENGFDEEVIKVIKQLCFSLRKQTEIDVWDSDYKWYQENVLERYSQLFIENLEKFWRVGAESYNVPLANLSIEQKKEIARLFFIRSEYIKEHYDGNNLKVREILRLLDEYYIVEDEFTFTNQPAENPRLNDHEYERIFDISKVNLKITFKSNIEFWRIGFRFSNSEDLESFPNKANGRYFEKINSVEVLSGEKRDDGWHRTKIGIVTFKGKVVGEINQPTSLEYLPNEELGIELIRDFHQSVPYICLYKEKEKFPLPLNDLVNLRFFKLSVWADDLSFEVKAKIELRDKEDTNIKI
jgi:hypothetical protein